MQGIAASPGIAIGRALVADRAKVAVTETGIPPEDVPAEVNRFLDAIEKVKDDLQLIKAQIEAERGAEHLYVLDTHLLILEDSMLTTETVVRIGSECINAEGSLKRTLVKFREFFDAIEDEYFRERIADVEIVGERILRRMTGISQQPLQFVDGKVIIVAHDLSPADVLQIDKNKVIGFVTDLGGKTSHTAILDRKSVV